MSARRTPKEIRVEDKKWKPSDEFDDDSMKLSALLENRGRKITYDHLAAVKMGDKENLHPLCVGVIPRLAESLSVLYRVPATRRLKRKHDTLADKDPQAETFKDLSQRMTIDNVWQTVDARRNLLCQCALVFVESEAHQSVQSRVFSPHEIFRYPTPGAADVIEQDEHIALQIRDGIHDSDKIYQLWQHEDDDTWKMWIVTEGGDLVGEQPYGDDGTVPFGTELPILMVYDRLPAGAAYLSIPESRLDFALNINALVNDLLYLVKLEAHTVKVMITDDQTRAPTEVGPDKLITIPEGGDVKTLGHQPQIDGVNDTIEGVLAKLCLSDSLPADYFSANRKIHTGPALKTAERDLEARRQRQAPIAIETERRAFRKIRAIHNVYAEDWGQDRIDEDLTLAASFGRQWQPVDAKELQEVFFKDLAVGAASIIMYLQERYNLDRPAAIDLYDQIQADRKAYPVEQQQNPAALVEGTNVAVGPGGAQKTPGAFNPELETSTEGASVTDAARDAIN
jgi:hypothetical protein